TYIVLGANNHCTEVGIGLTNAGGTPLAAESAEAFLTDKPLTPENIAHTADLAAQVAQPSSDLRGPAEYKVAMVRELTRRALTRAGERANG
ncbi:MAG: xanthine dehydrogenase family protein subunit M, partial [Verrucomicrobia bacterium]|nr:xanthine dehydrogenase family protein subunit M [Verrucomicrobiota bacterium]